MASHPQDIIQFSKIPELSDATLVLAFTGWMDGGDVSTGTVNRLVDLLDADQIAEIDPEPFYIYNFPGTMEMASLFRPSLEIEEGRIINIEMPKNTFYCHEEANLLLFVGKEPNMHWRAFGESIFSLADQLNVRRILFVGSFGGSVPHTREPRLYVTCSDPELLSEMEQFGVRRTGYNGPGSFTSYLLSQAPSAGIKMTSLIAEIPAYLQGTNPSSIEAVTRRLAKILQLPLDTDSLRSAGTEWEMEISSAVEEDEELAEKVRQLEEEYDTDLLEMNSEEI